MRQLQEYHHFKKDKIDAKDCISLVERYVVDLLLNSDLPDSKRDSSICWELKHQSNTAQFARILALKRGLPVDICAVGLLFHDINSIVHGKYKNHAREGTPIAMDIIEEIGDFTGEELDQIKRIIRNHSDKHKWTDDPFQEIGKDADVLDCFLYDGAFDYYLGHKPLPIFKEYLKRAKKVWKELGIPEDPRFHLLDEYGESWFQKMQNLETKSMRDLLAILLQLSDFDDESIWCPPPFTIFVEDENTKLYTNAKSWRKYVEGLDRTVSVPDKPDKIEMIGSIIKETTVKKSTEEASDRLSSSSIRRYISSTNFDEATNLLLKDRKSSNSLRFALLFWPIVGIYESLSGDHLVKRFDELGINI